MLFMVIERFEGDDMVPAYRRLHGAGRGLPEGVTFLGSWIEAGFRRCFQLMACDDLRRLQQWVLHWRGTGTTFEVVPVIEGREAAELVAPLIDAAG
jgi:hypothetical protein